MAAKKKKKVSLRDKLNPKAREESERLTELKALATKVNTALGTSGAVYLGTEQRPFERIKTGIVALDYVLGGGLVKGQMVQFSGEDSSAKTTAAMICAGSVQALGGTVVWVAGEGFDKKWAEKLGVVLEDMIVITADTGDTAMESAITMLQHGLVDLLVLDSFQSLGTTREMDSGVEDEAYAGAGAPQMWGRVMRKTYSAMNAGAHTAIVGISQVRSPIGKWSPNGQPEPEGTQIWAIKHWKAAEILFRKGEVFSSGESGEKKKLLGREFKLKCKKNKTAMSEGQSSFELKYEKGFPYIDNKGTLFRLARANDLIQVKGAWYSAFGLRAQGEDAYCAVLAEDDDALEALTDAVYQVIQQ